VFLFIRSPARPSPCAACNRFPFNNFKFFLLSFQSPLHLSLAVLVRYRSPTSYLALGGVYHPFQAALSSNPTRCRPSLRIIALPHPPVGGRPLRESHPLCFTPFHVTWDLWFALNLEDHTRLQFPVTRFGLQQDAPTAAVDPGFQAWAFPSSLAVTKGITVVFFSSAY